MRQRARLGQCGVFVQYRTCARTLSSEPCPQTRREDGGTGKPQFYITGERNDWGYAQWAKPILNVMFDGGMGLVEYQCKQLLDRHYHRISPALERAIDVDSCDLVEDLVAVAESLILGESGHWLKNNWGLSAKCGSKLGPSSLFEQKNCMRDYGRQVWALCPLFDATPL